MLNLVLGSWFIAGPILLVMLWRRVSALERRVRGSHVPTPRPPPPPRPAAAAPAAAVAPREIPARASTPPAPRFSWEELLAGKWLAWIGAFALIVGAGFFYKYAIDQGLIGPSERVWIGLLTGAAAVAGGAIAMSRSYQILGHALVASGIGVLYFALYAAFAWYRLVDQLPAFAGMIVVTASAMVFAVVFHAQATAILGLIGGFLTPWMLSTGQDAQWVLFSYILMLDVGVLGIASFRKWNTLERVALLGTLGIWIAWYDEHYAPEKLERTAILMTASFLLFCMLGVWQSILRRAPARPGHVPMILAPPLAYFAGIYTVTARDYSSLHGEIAAGLGAFYLGLALVSFARDREARLIPVALIGVAVLFLGLAIPLELTGHWIPIAWAGQSLVLVALGLRFHDRRLRVYGFLVFALVQFALLQYGAETLDDPERFRTRFTAEERVEVLHIPDPGPGGSPAEPETLWQELLNGRMFSFLASAIVAAILAWEYRRRLATVSGALVVSMTQTATILLAAAPITLLALLLLETYSFGHRHDWIPATGLGVAAIWTALGGLALVAMARSWGPPGLAGVGLFVFALLALDVLATVVWMLDRWGSTWRELETSRGGDSDTGAWRWFLVNPRGAGLLVASIAAAAGAYVVHGIRAATPASGARRGNGYAVAPLAVLAYVSGLVLFSLEIYAQGVIRAWETTTNLAITYTWAIYATATLVAGICVRAPLVRVLALSLFLVTTAKVFLLDVWQLSATIRWLAFGGLGVALLTVSFLYRRYRERIRAWMAP